MLNIYNETEYYKPNWFSHGHVNIYIVKYHISVTRQRKIKIHQPTFCRQSFIHDAARDFPKFHANLTQRGVPRSIRIPASATRSREINNKRGGRVIREPPYGSTANEPPSRVNAATCDSGSAPWAPLLRADRAVSKINRRSPGTRFAKPLLPTLFDERPSCNFDVHVVYVRAKNRPGEIFPAD